MKNNSILTTLVFILAFVVAAVYSVLYYTGIFPAVSATVSNGVTISLVALASLALMPYMCMCKTQCLCKAVKSYLPSVIFGAVGLWVTSGFLPLVTVSTRISYVLAQFVSVFFGAFLPVIWGFFLWEVITKAVCGCRKDCGDCNNNAPDDGFELGYNKYKY